MAGKRNTDKQAAKPNRVMLMNSCLRLIKDDFACSPPPRYRPRPPSRKTGSRTRRRTSIRRYESAKALVLNLPLYRTEAPSTLTMAANNSTVPRPNEILVHAPAAVVAGVGHKSRAMLQEVGSLFWFIIHTVSETFDRVRRGRAPFRAESFFRHTERAGVGSVPLVAMVSFFLGLTMALLTGYQLQRFGTERLVPGLVSIAFTRELGPLLTGIMLAARIGAAFTAELGTMEVSEEVEAIEAMGISPLRFLVAPRMLALILLMPCLSVISSVAAIIATSLVSRAYFNIAFVYFNDLVLNALLIRDIITGIA